MMAENPSLLRISELASKSGVTPRTVRFYVQEGLIPQPQKSRKTLALYSEDCVEKLKTIKKAQSEKFLPLVVIRKILEANNFDYNALFQSDLIADAANADKEPDPQTSEDRRVDLQSTVAEMAIPEDIIMGLTRLNLIKPIKKNGIETISALESEHISNIARLHQKGIDCEDVLGLFSSIRTSIEAAVDIELKSVIDWMMKNPIPDINDVLLLEQKTSRSFIDLIRAGRIKKIMLEYKTTADNAYRASADEGFALPEAEIIEQVNYLEQQLSKKFPDIRILSDIALGYSCIGKLRKSLQFLRRVLKIEPNNPDAQVRLIWYRRFAKSKDQLIELRQQMENIIGKNPGYALGHAFLATWYAIELSETDDPKEILKKINLCRQELELSEKSTPRDLHESVIIRYAKGKIPFWVPLSSDQQKHHIAAFQDILDQKEEIDNYYKGRMPFFPKWLWPNVYYFYGLLLIELNSLKLAKRVLSKGREFNVISPYRSKIEEAIIRTEGSG